MSISSGTFQNELKDAIIYLVLNKPALELTVLSNYYLVSNLPFLSKVIE